MGFISWKITRKNNVHVPQPSKMAASSISLGIDFNAPIYRKFRVAGWLLSALLPLR